MAGHAPLMSESKMPSSRHRVTITAALAAVANSQSVRALLRAGEVAWGGCMSCIGKKVAENCVLRNASSS